MNVPTLPASQVKDNYFDQNSLNAVKLMGKHNDPQAMKEVAKKFEAMFLQQVMKSMRDANEVFNQDNPFSSQEEKFHQDMLDQQLVVNLTSGEGMGLAKTLYAQLMKNNKTETNPSSDTVKSAVLPELHINPVFKRITEKPTQVAPIKTSQKKPVESDPQEFIARIKPYAEKAAKELNVGVDVILAQTALETGWGKFVLHDQEGKNTFNLFNIKAGSKWAGDKVSADTLEFVQGSPVKQKSNFRQYDSYEKSFNDYVSLIKNSSRYSVAANAKNANEYIDGLQQGGYATDPDYAKKIKQILKSDFIQDVISTSNKPVIAENTSNTLGGISS